VAKKTYTENDLSKTLDKLDAQLSKSDPEPEDTAAELVKSLADVAKGAIDLATESKARRTGTRKRPPSVLAKADKDEDEKEEEDEHEKREEVEKAEKEDDDDDEDGHGGKLPAWLKDKVDDGKAEGEMQYAGDREDYGGTELMTNAGGESKGMRKNIGHMGKSVQVGDMEVVDVGNFLATSLAKIDALSKALWRSERREKTLIKGLLAMEDRLQRLEDQNVEQARFSGLCAKALGHMIETHEAALTQPTGPSRYASMEKSIALAQRQIDHDGGTVFKCRGEGSHQNIELLSKAVMTRKITPEQASYIKKTERLPAGITLN